MDNLDDMISQRIYQILEQKIAMGAGKKLPLKGMKYTKKKTTNKKGGVVVGGVQVGGKRKQKKGGVVVGGVQVGGTRKQKNAAKKNPWLIFLAGFRENLKSQGINHLTQPEIVKAASEAYHNNMY